jgi:hypothetical protein
MWAFQDGEDVGTELESMLPDEVSDIVARHKQAGISIVNDGEISKPGFANYISTRVEGSATRLTCGPSPTLRPSPTSRRRSSAPRPQCHQDARHHRRTALHGHDELQRDIENLKRAAELNGIDDVFKTSASPGDPRLPPRRWRRRGGSSRPMTRPPAPAAAQSSSMGDGGRTIAQAGGGDACTRSRSDFDVVEVAE